jgi:hypothetical protein
MLSNRIETNKMNKRIGQTILAIVLALSVAMLPATVGLATGVAAATEMSVTQAMPDCDHHQHNAPADKTQKPADHGACMAACAAICFGFTATDVSGIAYLPPVSASLTPLRASTAISSLMGSPPFRPPRS